MRLGAAALMRSRAVSSSVTRLTPLEAFTQVQLGIIPPLGSQRLFLTEFFQGDMEQRGISEAKLYAMDHRLCTQLLRQLLFQRYLNIPFRVFSFDMEFTGLPTFTADGPTEDIVEIGVYSPARDATFAQLVTPLSGRPIGADVVKLTGISQDMLDAEGRPFLAVWDAFMEFINTPEPEELPGSDRRILLLSHGGKMADVSLLKWALERSNRHLPSHFIFGDTIHLIRDAHRRRPVTVDRHPPSWRLSDLIEWLRVPLTLPAHRAGNDAKMTWDALFHTLERYGDENLTPRQQLVTRFFDKVAREEMSGAHRSYPAAAPREELGELQSSFDIDFDDIFSQRGGESFSGGASAHWASEQEFHHTGAGSAEEKVVEPHAPVQEFVL